MTAGADAGQEQMPAAERSPEARPRVLLVDRGDALTDYLSAAVRHRCDVVGRVDVDLSRAERLLVAATTFRPQRRVWVDRFFKSGLAVRLRSARANRTIRGLGEDCDVILQTHALFALDDPRTVLYVDCTHRQSMEHWPDWNPLQDKALQRWLSREREQYHRAAHVFAFCGLTRDSLVDDYGVPTERVTVVGAGANVTELPAVGSRPTSGPPTVLFVGNDFVRKGGHELLRAFALVRERVPDARLRLVGAAYAIPEYDRPDGVEVVGRVVDRDELSQLYAEATLLAVPSIFDPFPLVVLEAMAHAVPVVATRQFGTPEMVVDGGTGVLVDPGPDLVPELADALTALLVDPARSRRLGGAGRRRVEEQFLWTHVVDRMTAGLTGAERPHTGRGAEPCR